MAKKPLGVGSLTTERKNEIAQAIAEHFVTTHFRLLSNGDCRRQFGETASKLGREITEDEVASFIQSVLSKSLAEMFGMSGCGINFRS